MSVKTVKYFKCDRCKKVFRKDPGFKTVKYNDGDFLNPFYVEYDLCPDCFKEYEEFIRKHSNKCKDISDSEPIFVCSECGAKLFKEVYYKVPSGRYEHFDTLKANDVPIGVIYCPVCGRRVQGNEL